MHVAKTQIPPHSGMRRNSIPSHVQWPFSPIIVGFAYPVSLFGFLDLTLFLVGMVFAMAGSVILCI